MKGIKINLEQALFGIVLIGFAVYTLYYLQLYFLNLRPWSIGDWLVIYHDGGFKRRGLVGSVLFLIQDVTHLKLEHILLFIVSIFYLFFYVNVYSLIKEKRKIFPIFIILCSPLTFFLPLVDPNVIGQKDIMLFCIFSFFITSIDNDSRFRYYIFSGIFFIATLIHEYFIFFIPYFLLAMYLFNERNISNYILLYCSVLIPVLLIIFFGGKINEGNSFEILRIRGVDLYNSGIMAWKDDFNLMPRYVSNWKGSLGYLISFIIGLSTFGFYIWNYHYTKRRTILYFFFIIVLYTLPLFFLAQDWGRWLNIHFTHLLLILLTLKSDSNNSSEKNKVLLIVCLLINFMFGMNQFGDGFHFYTKFNILLLKINDFLF